METTEAPDRPAPRRPLRALPGHVQGLVFAVFLLVVSARLVRDAVVTR